ncbi:MAG: protein-L-isoaspartate O-methyltransferase, partial [Rhizobacter sp.]
MNDETRRAPKFPLRLDELDGKRAKAAPAAAPAPTGIGLDSAEMRRRMALRLRQAGVNHEAVLNAMATVPRHQFVDAALVAQAYEDTSLPIGHGQTISKP